MKISALRAAVIGLVATASFAAPALAQTPSSAPPRPVSGADALNNPLSGDNATSSDPFAQNGSNQMSTILNILQRATSGGYAAPEEFSQQQRDSISSEASDFRSRQLELLQQQSQPSVLTSPVPTSPVPTSTTEPTP